MKSFSTNSLQHRERVRDTVLVILSCLLRSGGRRWTCRVVKTHPLYIPAPSSSWKTCGSSRCLPFRFPYTSPPRHTKIRRREKSHRWRRGARKNLSKQSWNFIKKQLPRYWFKTCNPFSAYMDSILVETQITFLLVSSNFASEAQELNSLKMSSKDEKMSLVNTVYYSSGIWQANNLKFSVMCGFESSYAVLTYMPPASE